MWKRHAAEPKPSRVETLQRLKSVLGGASPHAQLESSGWDDLEPNPWQDSDKETLLTFPAEEPVGEQLQRVAELAELTSEPTKEDATSDEAGLDADRETGDHAGSQAAVAAFHVAVSEARKDAEAQLASAAERMRKSVVEEHAAEIGRLAERHAKELEQTHETTEAEVAQRVREEESQRLALEIARVRDELEQRYADDLQRAQAAVVDSFKGLTTSISGSF